MSRDEITNEQILAAQGGDSDAMWAVLMGCDAMLRGIVRSVAPAASREDAEDYLQEARAVVIQRVRDYKSEASAASLTSYIYRAARRAVQEAHIVSTCAVSVPASAVIQIRYLLWQHKSDRDKVWAELEKEAQPTHRISFESFLGILDALGEATSFDAPVNGDSDSEALTLADVLADSAPMSPVHRRDLAHWLLAQIPQRQAYALRAYYGIGMSRQEEAETCADLAVKPGPLRVLRSRGTERARAVADAHGLMA